METYSFECFPLYLSLDDIIVLVCLPAPFLRLGIRVINSLVTRKFLFTDCLSSQLSILTNILLIPSLTTHDVNLVTDKGDAVSPNEASISQEVQRTGAFRPYAKVQCAPDHLRRCFDSMRCPNYFVTV